MDEEKNQSNSSLGNQLKQGLEKQAKQASRKLFKKVIATIIPILLKLFVIIFIITVFVMSISNFIDKEKGEESKDASDSSISYITGVNDESAVVGDNQIIVDLNNVNSNGAYILTYKFENQKSTERAQLKQIKKDIIEQNVDLDLTKFSDSELKIIAVLMYNGLDVKKYNEEDLKALALFIKADIASQNFDLRKEEDIGKEVDLEEIAKNDYVYGTLQVHKITTDSEKKLQYIPYGDEDTPGTFCYMDKHDDLSLIDKFSINDKENLVVASWSKTSLGYTYVYSAENKIPLTENDMAKIPEDQRNSEGVSKTSVRELPDISYKNNINRYILNYGILSDLLISTQNPDFCLEIAELAFNGKIIINLREELAQTTAAQVRNYTSTTVLYDYLKYKISGKDEKTTYTLQQIAQGEGNPSNSSVPSSYGWKSSMGYSETGEYGGTKIYNWSTDGEEYQLRYITTASYPKWNLYKKVEKVSENNLAVKGNSNLDGDLIVNDHIKEEYEEYTIDEDCTDIQTFDYTVITNMYSESNTYKIDLEVDTWCARYEKKYGEPTTEEKTTGSEIAESIGQFPEEASIISEISNETEIKNDVHVMPFINEKMQEYKQSMGAKKVSYKLEYLTVKQKSKLDCKGGIYSSKTVRHKLGEEIVDDSEIVLKNVAYINGNPTFTKKDENGNIEKGFLYIYDAYVNVGTDLFLEDDAENKLFELLESDSKTVRASETIKGLLYIYDGIDRGVTNLHKTFKVFDIKFNDSSTVSPFGCRLTREEFIELAEKANSGTVLASIAGEFYDVCTQSEYNVNPCLAYAWAALESGYGNSAPYNNLFGMGIYNGASSGVRYDTYAESIEDFCKWVVDAATPGTVAYNSAYDRAQEFATVNSHFNGGPEKNVYVLFCRYMHLGNTHIADENGPYASYEARMEDYKKQGSGSGSGGRYYLYHMYELGGIYEGEYQSRCGSIHVNGTDPTTLEEQADYVQYNIDKRIKIAKSIFGNNCLVGGSIVDTAYLVADHFLNSGVDVHYAGDSVDVATNNGRVVKSSNIQASWDLPIEQPERYGVVCATFVAFTLWQGGLIDEETINQYSYNGCTGIDDLLMNSKYAGEWQIITNFDELQDGDIVRVSGHVFIYVDGGMCLDQAYCVLPSNYASTGYDSRRKLSDASNYRATFWHGFRYIG